MGIEFNRVLDNDCQQRFIKEVFIFELQKREGCTPS
jgi:hypothetical protein